LPGPKQGSSFTQHRQAGRPAANNLSRRFVLCVDINDIVLASEQVEYYYPTCLDCQTSRNKKHEDQRDDKRHNTNSMTMPRSVRFTEQQRSYSQMSIFQKARREIGGKKSNQDMHNTRAHRQRSATELVLNRETLTQYRN